MTGRVVVVGSLNVDLVARVRRLPAPGETVTGADLVRTPGGKGLNQAVAAARAGVPVVLVGAVGDDEHGAWLRSVAADEGIDGAGLAVVPAGATGTALITVAADGANTIVVSPGANGAATAAAVAPGGPAAPRAGDVVLCQAEVPATTVTAALAAGRRAGATTMVNLAPFRPPGPQEWDLVDVLVVNETELAGLLAAEGSGAGWSGDDSGPEEARGAAASAAGALLRPDRGPGWIVVTLGAAGAVAVDRDGSVTAVGAPTVAVVDTVGAGDCLTGWLGAGLARGAPVPVALGDAVRAAAVAVQRTGAVTAMPTRADLVHDPDDGS